MAESSVRTAAEAYLSTGAQHAEGVAFDICRGDISDSDDPTYASTPDAGLKGKIISILVLHAGNTAVVHVQWVSHAGWLTLLQEKGEWVVISNISSAASGPSTPTDMAAVIHACWDEYCAANHACDGLRMAQVFHPKCRLTYTGPDGALVIKSRDVFVHMVSERYSLPLHAPYAHLKDDPRVAAKTSLLSASFATPDLCMVVLKVGHPPMLWTDVLTCARLGDEGKWWIVAKSSCSEPLFAKEAK